MEWKSPRKVEEEITLRNKRIQKSPLGGDFFVPNQKPLALRIGMIHSDSHEFALGEQHTVAFFLADIDFGGPLLLLRFLSAVRAARSGGA